MKYSFEFDSVCFNNIFSNIGCGLSRPVCSLLSVAVVQILMRGCINIYFCVVVGNALLTDFDVQWGQSWEVVNGSL